MEDIQAIFLNGASSSGKNSLAKALQRRLARPYIFFAEDMFFDGWPQGEYSQLSWIPPASRSPIAAKAWLRQWRMPQSRMRLRA